MSESGPLFRMLYDDPRRQNSFLERTCLLSRMTLAPHLIARTRHTVQTDGPKLNAIVRTISNMQNLRE